MKNPIKIFGPNLLGRDFVIGDLHGAMPCFRNLCANIHFDPKKDRMFSVADLVDRGPESVECLRLLNEDWFGCVLSNHEHMMLEAFRDRPYGEYWMYNGGAWGYDAYMTYVAVKHGVQVTPVPAEHQEIFDLVDKVEELPFLITINHKSGKKFHILHAELPPKHSSEITDDDLADPSIVQSLATIRAGDGDAFLWARYLWSGLSRRSLTEEQVIDLAQRQELGRLMNENRSHVISGHTILRHPMTIGNHTNIDTCAYGACEEHPPTADASTKAFK